ncbi:MAG: methyl-accepting chemotaxis protein [Cellvibrionaceae bacterium]
MKIQTKLVIGASALIALALVTTSVIIGYTSATQSKKALTKATEKELVAVAGLTAESIENYFQEIKGQIQVMSAAPSVVEHTYVFNQAYYRYKEDATGLPDINIQKQAVTDYYQNHFGKKYQDINSKNTDVNSIVNQLDENSLALQYQYIAANENPLGSKEILDEAKDGTLYSQTHKALHPHTRNFLNHFGFYDIFIANIETGHIIYSVFKELDYATSLIDGPYANTSIGEVFRKAAQATHTDDVFLSDFAPYYPSYEAAASFMASPIYSGNEKIGVLIFQMPVVHFNTLMTHHEKWSEMGLGKTGESIIVGQDKKIRSLSRGFAEDKSAYLQQLKDNNVVDDRTLALMDKQDSNMLLQTMDNPATNAALNGEKGSATYTNFAGRSVLAAYEPVTLLGQKWAMVAEMDMEEVTLASGKLISQIIWVSVIVSLSAIAIGVFAVIIFARTLVKPLNQTITVMQDLAQGDGDLTARLTSNSEDEIGILSRYFNTFIEKIQVLMIKVEEQATTLSSSASIMAEASTDNKEGATKQRESTQAVSHSMSEMSIAAHEVAESASSAEQAATSASEATMKGSSIVESTTDAIQKLAANVEEAVTIIKALEATSDNIGSVVGVINSIAEQTNLLALNAAIEAARAGEQGRGFAVVADEVRALASRTQESTLEINNIIEQLQQNANSAVGIMNHGHEAVIVCVDESEKAKQSLQSISQQIQDITNMNLRIATSAEEQSAVGKTMNENITEIDGLASSNANSADTVLSKSNEINDAANQLDKVIHQFKLR